METRTCPLVGVGAVDASFSVTEIMACSLPSAEPANNHRAQGMQINSAPMKSSPSHPQVPPPKGRDWKPCCHCWPGAWTGWFVSFFKGASPSSLLYFLMIQLGNIMRQALRSPVWGIREKSGGSDVP